MLGKLLKYEFKSTARNFLLMYLVFFLVTVFNKVCLELSIINSPFWSMFKTLFMIAYVLFCAAIFVITAVLIVTRFYRNLMCDEGYLMFTLPVTVNQHILAKMLTAFVWLTLSTIIFLLSVLLLLAGHGVTDFFQQLFQALGAVMDYGRVQIYLFFFIYGISTLLSPFYTLLQVYMSIAIGQLVNKHRVLTSFAAYFGINFLIQNITSFVLLFSGMMNEHFEFMYSDDITIVANGFLGYMNAIGIFSLLLSLVLSAVYFFLTSFILNKKLNLE